MAVGAYRGDDIQYPEDIETLKKAIPEIKILHDSVIDVLYGDFSDSWFCAGWMQVNDMNISYFRAYLFTDKRY